MPTSLLKQLAQFKTYLIAGGIAVAVVVLIVVVSAVSLTHQAPPPSTAPTVTQERQAKIDAHREELKAQAEAQAKAEQAAYEKTPAGKLCKQNPTWSKEDCQRVIDNEIWLGMDIYMVKAERGSANHVNRSNYGNGDEYQACWYDYTPSCFYWGVDGKVTSYN